MIDFYDLISKGFTYGSIIFLGVGFISFALRFAFNMLKKAI